MSAKATPIEIDPKTLERIAVGLNGLRFGSVEVVVHDSKVVRIVRNEKLRLDEGEPSAAPRK